MLSVVVPTYNEAGSVPKLAERLHAALGARDWELVIVDDGSPDGTADIAAALAPRIPTNVVRRAGKAGLASAVIAGFAAARGDILVVMDADLSHPPELVPALLSAIERAQPFLRFRLDRALGAALVLKLLQVRTDELSERAARAEIAGIDVRGLQNGRSRSWLWCNPHCT